MKAIRGTAWPRGPPLCIQKVTRFERDRVMDIYRTSRQLQIQLVMILPSSTARRSGLPTESRRYCPPFHCSPTEPNNDGRNSLSIVSHETYQESLDQCGSSDLDAHLMENFSIPARPAI
jgi:hypothetical protein